MPVARKDEGGGRRGGRSVDMYFTNADEDGPVQSLRYPRSIDVLAPDKHTVIGTATETWRIDDGFVLWKLTIKGREISGRFVIVDREFRPAQ
jgi:hypothetical protein